MAATEGVTKAWVADQLPERAIGTAFGIFSAVSGGALLLASIAAGLLWSHVSPRAPFLLGAATAGAALLLLLLRPASWARRPSPEVAPPPV